MIDMLNDLLQNGEVHSPPRRSASSSAGVDVNLNDPVSVLNSSKSCAFLKKHDKTSLYHLWSLSGATLSSAITNWVEYRLNKLDPEQPAFHKKPGFK